MPYQKVTIALSVILSSSFLTNASAEGLFLRNLHTLDDEYRGYCLDIPGARERINRDSSLGARACKYIENNVDQMFEWVAPDRIRATEYENLCGPMSISRSRRKSTGCLSTSSNVGVA